MPDIALLLLQTAATIATPDAAAALRQPVAPAAACTASANAILVCGRGSQGYRLPAVPAPSPVTPPKAQWKIFGNATMNLHGEQRSMPQNGATAPAVMATIKLPF